MSDAVISATPDADTYSERAAPERAAARRLDADWRGDGDIVNRGRSHNDFQWCGSWFEWF
jgi:hypothetical protein